VVAASADTVAVPVEGFAASDNADEETAASATGGVAAAFSEFALLCHARSTQVFLQTDEFSAQGAKCSCTHF